MTMVKIEQTDLSCFYDVVVAVVAADASVAVDSVDSETKE
jgi:hypothetical protein